MPVVNRSTHKSNIDDFIDRQPPYDGNPLIQKLEDQVIREEIADSAIFREPVVVSMNSPASAISLDFDATDRYDIDSNASTELSFLITVSNIRSNETGVVYISKRADQTFSFANATVTPTEETASQIGKTAIAFFIKDSGGIFFAQAGYKITIGTNDLYDSSVTEDKIATSAVTNSKLGSSSVTSIKIASSAVTASKLATNSVTTSKIADQDVTTAKIDDEAVTTAKIDDEAVTTAKIDDEAVTTAKIDDEAVTNDKVADEAIDTDQIVDDAVTSDKLATNSVTNLKMANNSVNTSELVNGSVTAAKIADNTIGSGQVNSTIVLNDGVPSKIVTRDFFWDMDTLPQNSTNFAGIDYRDILSPPLVVIRPDNSDGGLRNLTDGGRAEMLITSATSIRVTLFRNAGGVFDNSDYNSTGVTRGTISFLLRQ